MSRSSPGVSSRALARDQAVSWQGEIGKGEGVKLCPRIAVPCHCVRGGGTG